MTTQLEAARNAVTRIEAQIADDRRRLNAAYQERELTRQAIVRGDATQKQLSSVAGRDLLIGELTARLQEHNREGDPIGVFAQLATARDRVALLEKQRLALAGDLARLRSQRDAGLLEVARAAVEGVARVMPYLEATGRDRLEVGRSVWAVKSYASETIKDFESIPGLELQLSNLGE